MGGTCGGLMGDAFSGCISLCTQSVSETCPNKMSIAQKSELCQEINEKSVLRRVAFGLTSIPLSRSPIPTNKKQATHLCSPVIFIFTKRSPKEPRSFS